VESNDTRWLDPYAHERPETALIVELPLPPEMSMFEAALAVVEILVKEHGATMTEFVVPSPDQCTVSLELRRSRPPAHEATA
jgi:hypothetical protein